ncbi:amino acid adenylation domain-containing protein [Lentzea sp.]|uniref:amino acid adenylation domain-containing protein n=1 Tax=Lentzea sp. TaxID=56099 RepID=UPI002ED29BF5
MTTDAQPTGRTLAELRRALLERQLAGRAPAQSTVDEIPALSRSRPLALSFAQQRLWLLDQLRPGQDEYLVPMAIRLDGELDVSALADALTAVVARHEVLRTRYVLDGREPVQVIDEPAPVPLHRTACAGDELQPVIAGLTRTPVDLRRDHPIKAHLVELGPASHVLVVCVHHIAFDDWSTGLLLRELSELYSAAVESRPPSLPEVRTQYGDYARWQRDRIRGSAGQGQLEHWRTRLSGLTALALFTDRPHPPEWQPEGGSEGFVIPAVVADALRSAGREAGATAFHVLLAAVHTFLSRYTGQRDIAVGVPSASRPRADLAGTIGYFGNMLVMRADLSADPSFAGLLDQVRATSVEAYAHQDVPFDWLVTELRTDRDLSRNPLFQVSLTVAEGDEEDVAMTGLTGTPVDVDWIAAKFDLSFAVTVTAEGDWTGDIVYPAALFDQDTVHRMARHFEALVAALAARPATPVSRLGFTTDLDRRDPVEAPTIPVGHGIHEAVARQAAEAGERTAVSSGAARLSYQELNEQANRLARHLRELGTGRGDLVGVRLTGGPQLVVALLAVLKAGAAYLPLDPEQPRDRVNFMTGDAAARLVITESALPQELDARTVVLDDAATQDVLDAYAADDLDVAVSPDDLAYVMYTSGSTGLPKGVMVTHRNVLRLFGALDLELATGRDDVWTAFHSYAFDFSVWEIWGALVHGSRLVQVPFEVSRSPEDFLRLLADEGVTVLSQTPSAFTGLTRALEERGQYAGLAVRAVVFGGEALDPGLLEPWFRLAGPDAPAMINMYGITETTVHTTVRTLTSDECRVRTGVGRSPIGRALADVRLHVLDDAGQLAPIGVPGEIHVGGAGVARGYHGRPALTAERFVPDPFGTEPGARLYRSGDLGRLTADGEVEYLGRADQQVKIRGHRIETGEVEAVLASHPAVTAAVVDVAWSGPGDGRVFGYVVTAGDLDAADVLRHAAARLPAYMMPVAVIGIPRIPLTVNGKLDRAALPEPRVESAVAYVAPRSVPETTAAAVLAEVLDVTRVGARDNFFSLGGDSILAVRAVGMLRARGFEVTVADLFRRQTVEEIAGLAGGPVEAETLVPPFALIPDEDRAGLPDGVVDAYPLAGAQAGMLYELLRDDDVHRYHNATSYPVREKGEFSLDALRRAAELVTTRHDVLRTSFDLATFSTPLQLVHARCPVEIRYTDLRDVPEHEHDSRLWQVVAAERADLFDVATAPLWRLHVVLSAPDRWQLCVVESHPILDGWSHNSFVMELLRTYEAVRDGDVPARSTSDTLRYADYIAVEQAAIRSPQDRAFWAERVTGRWERLTLPEIWSGPAGAPHYEVRVPTGAIEPGLRELARLAGVPYKTVLFAAYLRVLGIAAGQESFFAGLVTNGRLERLHGDEVRGMFINIVPCPAPAAADTWVRYVGDVFAEEVAIQAHRHYPLATMQRDWGGDVPLIDTIFNYLNFHVLDSDLVEIDDVQDVSPNEFAIAVSTEHDCVAITARPERVAPEFGELLGRLFTQVLTAMATAPHGDPRQCLLDPADRRRAVAMSARPAVPADESIVEILDRWAVDRAGEPAVCETGRELTYGELRRRSCQVAAGLVARGIGREDVVAITLPRGAELIATFIGVLRAGAAFLILDPAQPKARRDTLLRESGAVVLIGPEIDADGIEAVDPAWFDDFTDLDAPVAVDPEALVYLVSTSGSTGTPKSVMLHHRGLTNFVGPRTARLDIKPGDRVAQVAPVVFDMALLEIFQALAHGGTVCVPDPDVLAVGDVLARQLAEFRVTHLVTVPSALAVLDPDQVPSLEVVAVGGEEFPPQLAGTWAHRVRLFNIYGPTECTIFTTGTEILPGLDRGITIGRPLGNVTGHVLDGMLDPVPIGVPGELCLGGPAVGRGYAARPDLTADRFVPDPFGDVPGARLYRTGDRVVRRQDGDIVFLGRFDQQVKVRGHRIELGEIESVLETHPQVRQAVAVVQGDTDLRRMVVFAAAADGSPVTEAELDDFLRARLPAYLLPDRIARLDDLPRTESGKLDRKALAAIEVAEDRRTPLVPPRNAVEATIAEVWQRVLGVDTAGVHDDFFQLGGHSLLAVRLASQLANALGHTVSSADVLGKRTIAGIAEAVTTGDSESAEGPLVWFRREGGQPPLLCVHPGGGSAHWYDKLADELPADQPVVAFQYEGAQRFPDGLTANVLARHYIDSLDVPLSEVRLMGWCSGSPIAWEMSRLLTEAGHQVTLTLLDPVAPVSDLDYLLRDFQECEDLFVQLCADGPDDQVRARALGLLMGLLAAEVPQDELTDEEWLLSVRGWHNLLKAILGYGYPFQARWPVNLVFSQEVASGNHEVVPNSDATTYLDSWNPLLADVTRTENVIPRGHYEVMEPEHVGLLARLLTELWGTRG